MPPESSPSSSPHLASPDLNPSFTKGVFLGEIREDLVFPFPELTAEEHESLRMILDSFRAFAAEHIDSSQLRPRRRSFRTAFAKACTSSA